MIDVNKSALLARAAGGLRLWRGKGIHELDAAVCEAIAVPRCDGESVHPSDRRDLAVERCQRRSGSPPMSHERAVQTGRRHVEWDDALIESSGEELLKPVLEVNPTTTVGKPVNGGEAPAGSPLKKTAQAVQRRAWREERTLIVHVLEDGDWRVVATLTDRDRARVPPFDAVELDLDAVLGGN